MNITEAIDALRPFTSKVPREALDYIRANWGEAEPVLLNEIDFKLQSPTAEDRDGLFLYAIHLCAEMRSRDAFPLYLKLCRLPKVVQRHVLGDILTETMSDMLARTCAGRVDETKALIEDSVPDEYARAAAMDSLLHLMLDGELSRDSLAEYCVFLLEKGLERRFSFIWDKVIVIASSIHADAALPLIKKSYERSLADPGFERLDHILSDFEISVDEALELTKKRHRVFESTEKSMNFFVCQWGKKSDPDIENEEECLGLLDVLKEQGRLSTAPSSRKKIGRNDPCPCGSGKKYKKCCLNGPSEAPPQVSVSDKPVRDKNISANDWMRAGYIYIDKHMSLQTFECWKRCWNELRDMLPQTLKNPEDAGVFEGHDFLVNWMQDFERLLVDLSGRNMRTAEFSVTYFKELLDRFPEMDKRMRSNLKADLARAMAVLGRNKQALDFLEEAIAEIPKDAQNYVVLAEMHGCDAEKYGMPLDLSCAMVFLQDALNHAEDCEDYDVVLSLKELQEWKTDMEKPLI